MRELDSTALTYYRFDYQIETLISDIGSSVGIRSLVLLVSAMGLRADDSGADQIHALAR